MPKEAAVAIVIAEVRGSPSVLLVRRAKMGGDPWSGDVALPGGRKRGSDPSLLDTAIRECAEETGVDLSGLRPVITLGPFRSHADPEMLVWAFAFTPPEVPKVVPGEEVEEAFWVPLAELNESKGMAEVKGRTVEAYAWRGRVIWGLTKRILDRALPLLSQLRRGRPGWQPT